MTKILLQFWGPLKDECQEAADDDEEDDDGLNQALDEENEFVERTDNASRPATVSSNYLYRKF